MTLLSHDYNQDVDGCFLFTVSESHSRKIIGVGVKAESDLQVMYNECICLFVCLPLRHRL